MFPRNKVDYLYRILCLLAFLIVIIFVDSSITIYIIFFAFYILTFMEKRIENIFLYIVTGISFIICLLTKNYLLLRIVLIIDYIHYFLNNESLNDFNDTDDRLINEKYYIRFENRKERNVDNNKICTIFVIVHMILLLLSIVGG